MSESRKKRFIQAADTRPDRNPWAAIEWLSNEELVGAGQIMMLRVKIEAGGAHPFHRHPTREEVLYVLSGKAEQWVEDERRILGPGEMAFVPQGAIHGTYNPFEEDVTFLAILAPLEGGEPDVIDVSTDEPWASMRQPRTKPDPQERTALHSPNQ